MPLAAPLRPALTLGLLALGAAALWTTRPRSQNSASSDEAKSASCLNNLRQISRAYAQYARDFDGKIPLAVDPEDRFNTQLWPATMTNGTSYERFLQTAPFVHVVLRPYLAAPQVFQCPSDTGWAVSRLAQPDFQGGGTIGLKDVRPSSFAKYGTSYYSWTIYGFNLLTVADIENPDQKVILFDGELWHGSANQPRGGELFLDGHAALLSKAQHEMAAPRRD